MSWEGAPYFRWVKMHRGVRYRVTCEQLGAMVWTREGSYKLANKWWERKLAEITGQSARVDAFRQTLREEDELSRLSKEIRALVEERNYLRDRLLCFAEQVADGETGTEPRPRPRPLTMAEARELAARNRERGAPPADPERERLIDSVIASDPDLDEVLALSAPGAAPVVDGTIKALADRWSADRADEAVKGVRSADGADNARIALSHFVAFAGPGAEARAIDFDLWRRWYVHCRGEVARRESEGKGGWSADYAKKVFGVARSFVRWLWERDVLAALPRNLDSRQHRFEAEAKEPPSFSNAEVRLFLDNATGQHKLHLLLMLNCGMTQKDISDLRKDQIDFAGGAVTRRRSKTKHKKGTPLVSYPLWPETLRLLREHLSDDPVYALLTRSKRRWVRKEIVAGGKLKKSDNVATLFQHLRRKVKVREEGKSLKVFRKTSATRLKGNKEYRDLRFFFLGHSARTVADRHYAAESQALLAEAVAWLGKEYGLV